MKKNMYDNIISAIEKKYLVCLGLLDEDQEVKKLPYH